MFRVHSAAMKMKKHKKKSKKNRQTDILNASVFCLDFEMPTADVVAEERASEVAYERELAALLLADGGDPTVSDEELRLRSALRSLEALPPATCASASPAAAALLAPLAAALRASHPQETRFLDEYKRLLEERREAEVRAVTEELMRGVESALAAEGAGGAGGPVLAAWLGAALVWRGPRVPGALPALRRLLQLLPPPQVADTARALRAALRPRELLAAGDALRGLPLAGPLRRAALAGLLGGEPAGAGGEPDARELRAALKDRWRTLDAAAQLTTLALAGRSLAGSGRAEAVALLAVLTPQPPPRDGHDANHLKVNAMLKTLQNLFKDT